METPDVEKWDMAYIRLRKCLVSEQTGDYHHYTEEEQKRMNDLDILKYKILTLIGESAKYRFELEDLKDKMEKQ